MNPISLLKEFLTIFGKQASSRGRHMKRVFQWRRYLEWKDLNKEEKIAAKRLLFVPIAAYFIFIFINQYIFTIIFLICLYFLYKKLEKGKLMK